jgi:hypothetical protein
MVPSFSSSFWCISLLSLEWDSSVRVSLQTPAFFELLQYVSKRHQEYQVCCSYCWLLQVAVGWLQQSALPKGSDWLVVIYLITLFFKNTQVTSGIPRRAGNIDRLVPNVGLQFLKSLVK